MRWFKDGSSLTDYNTVVLHLDVTCEWQPKGKELFLKGETDSNKLYINSNGSCHTLRSRKTHDTNERRFQYTPKCLTKS
jgi:hypothetical protein